MFLKICNIHSKVTVLESLFNKVVGLKACNFTKNRLQHWYFPVNIAKILRTPILKKTYSLRFSVRIREIADQNNPEYGHFLRNSDYKKYDVFM